MNNISSVMLNDNIINDWALDHYVSTHLLQIKVGCYHTHLNDLDINRRGYWLIHQKKSKCLDTQF